MYQEEIIEHHGVKGQKWGARRKIAKVGSGMSSVKRNQTQLKINRLQKKIDARPEKMKNRFTSALVNDVRSYRYPLKTLRADVNEIVDHPINSFINPVQALSKQQSRIRMDVDKQINDKRRMKIEDLQVKLGKQVLDRSHN